jgi:hypothetical protein
MYQYGIIPDKKDPANTGGIHPFPLPVLFPYFSINMEMDGINIEIRAGWDGIFSVHFHPYWGARRHPASNLGSFHALCSLQVLTYHFIAFFVPSNANRPLIILIQMLYFLDHVGLHTNRAEFVEEEKKTQAKERNRLRRVKLLIKHITALTGNVTAEVCILS